MNTFKLDIMTLLVIGVSIGVILTMSLNAGNEASMHSMTERSAEQYQTGLQGARNQLGRIHNASSPVSTKLPIVPASQTHSKEAGLDSGSLKSNI